MLVAVTGGIGSGKSTAAKILTAALDGVYLDTDEMCRFLMEPGEKGYIKFIEDFGRDYLHADGRLNRDKLRRAVFADISIKAGIEAILHPLVRSQMVETGKKLEMAQIHCVVEVPLLFEVGWLDAFAATVLVYVPEDVSCERVVRRDNLSVEMVRAIIANQMDIEEKRILADWIIDNSSTMVSTVCQASFIAHALREVE